MPSDLTVLILDLSVWHFCTKPGGKSPSGRTTVWMELICWSGGVGLSMLAGAGDRVSKMSREEVHGLSFPPFSQTRAEAQTISRVFSLWLTTVRAEMLMTVSGGVSRGLSASVKGRISLGSLEETSSLHHDTCLDGISAR